MLIYMHIPHALAILKNKELYPHLLTESRKFFTLRWQCTRILFFFFFCFLWPHLWHKEVPKLRGWNENEAAVAELCHNHSNPVSKPHLPSMATACSKAGSLTQWVRPGVEPTSSETLCWVLNLMNRNRNSMHNDSLLTIHRVNTWCSIQTLL